MTAFADDFENGIHDAKILQDIVVGSDSMYHFQHRTKNKNVWTTIVHIGNLIAKIIQRVTTESVTQARGLNNTTKLISSKSPMQTSQGKNFTISRSVE